MGQLDEARRACRKALQVRPDLPEGHLLFSEIYHQAGDATKARESASRAFKLRPGWSEAYVALGNAEALAGNFALAEENFRSAIAAGSPGAGVHANLGHVLRKQARLEEARAAYERALSHAPDALELLLNMAQVESELGNKDRALDLARTATTRFPAAPQAHFALGNALTDLGNHEEALASYGCALELDPAFLPALFNRARAFAALGRSEDAVAALRELLARDPPASDARDQLIRLLHSAGRFVEMEAVARQGIALHPDAINYSHQLAVSLWWQRRRDEALAAFNRVHALVQDRTSTAYRHAKLDEAMCLLALGRYGEGWDAYAWRPSRSAWRARFPEIIDDARDVVRFADRKGILVIGEQGFGDELFFLRFAMRLSQAGHRLVGRFHPKLEPLLGRIPGLFHRVVNYDGASSFTIDAAIVSGDLPLAAGQESAAPLMLPVDPVRQKIFRTMLKDFGPPPYVAVTWQAGALPDERKIPGAFYLFKEVPPDRLGSALRRVRATYIIVQRRPAPQDIEAFTSTLGRQPLNLSGVNDDLEDALALLSVVDDYVGVSNTNMHLRAGCHGAPARVLVPSNAEWRWGLAGARSVWFPSFAVYRADPRGEWDQALRAMGDDLCAALAA